MSRQMQRGNEKKFLSPILREEKGTMENLWWQKAHSDEKIQQDVNPEILEESDSVWGAEGLGNEVKGNKETPANEEV